MAESSNRLIRICQELKRRKVFGVVTTYAATAYIIIEVTNNIVDSLVLPDLIGQIVVLLLIIGLPIVIILAWIFDFTPKGIKKTESLEGLEVKETTVKPVKHKLRASYILNAVLIIIVAFLAYPRIFNRDTPDTSKGKVSVTVTPFQNLTNDTIWNVWQVGIQDNLIASLSNSSELKVRQIETINNYLQSKGLVNYASITPSMTRNIGRKLEASVIISGSINRSADIIRISSQLIDSKKNEVIRSFQIESPAEEGLIFNIIDSLSRQLRNFLLLTNLLKESSHKYEFISKTCTPEAYRFFMQGQRAFNKKDLAAARDLYLKAIALDSNFYAAEKMLSTAYRNDLMFKQAKEWCLKAYNKRDQMPLPQAVNMNWLYALLFETPVEEMIYLNQLLELDDQNPAIWYELGRIYVLLNQYDKAIQVLEKNLEIYKKWGSKPRWVYDYIMLGFAYQKTGNYKKEMKLFKKAEKNFPDDPELIYRQSVLALSLGDTTSTNDLIKKYIIIRRGNLATDADIAFSLGDLYLDADLPEIAVLKIRESLMLDPENAFKMNFLAYVLIENELNIPEGLDLVSKSLLFAPENYDFLHTKGWGLYKQGKYQESLATLQKSWDLRRQYAEYDYPAFLHLEAAKKAVAELE